MHGKIENETDNDKRVPYEETLSPYQKFCLDQDLAQVKWEQGYEEYVHEQAERGIADADNVVEFPRRQKEKGPFANVAAYDFPAESTLERRDFLYGHHLLRETVSLTAALGGTGKSSKAIVEALAMTTGQPLLGIPPAGCLRVLLINLEDNRKEMDRRIRAVMKFFGLRKADVGDRLFVIAKGELRLQLALYRRGELTYGRTAQLVAFLKANKIDVLSVDPLRKTHRVRENDNGDMGLLIEV
jgi:AAA domain